MQIERCDAVEQAQTVAAFDNFNRFRRSIGSQRRPQAKAIFNQHAAGSKNGAGQPAEALLRPFGPVAMRLERLLVFGSARAPLAPMSRCGEITRRFPGLA